MRVLLVAMLVLLGACGDLPQPFRGRAGGNAAQLAAPPGVRVAVPRSDALMLDTIGADRFAETMADALRVAEVPAVAAEPLPLDWRVGLAVTRRGSDVVLRYTLRDADGGELGSAEVPPMTRATWAEQSDEMRRDATRVAARNLATMILRAEAARKATDPAALAAGGPPRIRLVPVGGAPGDGNSALTARMSDFLTQAGFLISDSATAASFAVQGLVSVAPSGTQGVQRVEILWVVSRRDGEELGRVLQLNEIPSGSLDRFWGDVAFAAAQEAAGGVQRVVSNAGGMPERRDGRAAATPVRGLEIPRDNDLPAPTSTAAAPAP
ncbi:hypothetical protein [Plastoroseomonas arctica]|uniref:Lipoprotein n=1 Tax=Plastoroseomonas arctica TaxID=1509237 RepID=A0AAF1K207_9PROT|nr:hypothetical protein [Plastoroseomonas arctica]MBR0655116.1 hypothetical protein [Plastoroseomonas arctica]